MPEASLMFFIGFALIILGIALSFIAAIIMFLKGVRESGARGVKGGGLIMLGPIPIIFGTDKETMRTLIILSIVLLIVALAFILIVSWLPLTMK